MIATPPISGSTTVVAVIGDPVSHSMSPAMHNAAFTTLGLDWVYVAFPVAADRGGDAVDAMRTLGLGGLNVTMPHKAAVAERVDRLTPAAEALGVCNTLFWDGDEIVGDSTDGDGFVDYVSIDCGHEVVGQKVAVLGAGGAARSIVEALGRHGPASIAVINRTTAKAESAASLAPMAEAADLEAVRTADLVINTTSVGMTGTGPSDLTPIPVDLIRPSMVVADIVYQPRVTPLLAAARAAGATPVGGIGMLVRQGARALCAWTQLDPPLDAMFRAVS